MLVVPLPFKMSDGTPFSEYVVELESINWVDPWNDDTNAAQSHIYLTPYFVYDFFLAFMFLRCHFFAKACMVYSPVNDRLYGKRVCQDAGFEPTFSFQYRASMRAYPISTFTLLSLTMIISFSYIIRIFERPYYSFVFNTGDDGVQFYNFDSLVSSLWFTVITMTSVGYGGIIASTRIGRWMTILSSLVGAFILSLLVAIITDWFIMEEKQT